MEYLVRSLTLGTIKDVERNHGVVLDLPVTSLTKLVGKNRPFQFISNRDDASFMNRVSGLTQVAIFPDPEQFYVPESNNKNLAGQEELLKVDEAEIIRKKMGIGGLRLVIGDVATHAGLVFAYFDKTDGRVRLHGQDYDYRYGRTETFTVGRKVDHGVTVVGNYSRVGGLYIGSWYSDFGAGDVWVVRLGVAAQE